MTEPVTGPAPRPAGRRERRKQQTRRSLEDAALELFARDGFDATTVEAIAARAEVSPRTFFRYFAAKEEVLDMGWETRRERLHSLVLESPAEQDDLTAALGALEAVAADLEPELDRVRLRARAAATSAALRGRTADTMTAWEGALALGLAARRGLDRPDEQAAVAAAAALGVWRWATLRWVVREPGVPPGPADPAEPGDTAEPLAALVRRAADRLRAP